jgi:hypothetical protein
MIAIFLDTTGPLFPRCSTQPRPGIGSPRDPQGDRLTIRTSEVERPGSLRVRDLMDTRPL